MDANVLFMFSVIFGVGIGFLMLKADISLFAPGSTGKALGITVLTAALWAGAGTLIGV